MNILVADDERISRKTISRIVQNLGQFIAVDNGKTAFASFIKAHESGHPFDLIILDVGMPGMLGTEVLFYIRKFEEKKNIEPAKRSKVVIITSHSDEETVKNSIKQQCNAYLIKPLNREKVIGKISELFNIDPEGK